MKKKIQSKNRIFIPFIDGILDYDCRKCGYSCCKSGVFVLNDKGKRIVLKKYPFLRYFCEDKKSKLYTIKNYNTCWFFENGKCSIQKNYGYFCKPIDARLYPFAVARCRDEYIITIYPCDTLHASKRSKNVSHKRILKDAQDAIRLNFLNGKINWTKKRLDLEKNILKVSKKFLNNSNYLEFAACQMALTKETKNTARIKQELLEYLALWKSFLGLEELSIENRKLTYELTYFTSLLRVSPRLRSRDKNKIPLALLALYFYMIIFSKVKKTKVYFDTYMMMLNDVTLALLNLKNEDLSFKNKSIEEKLDYLRTLRKLSAYLKNPSGFAPKRGGLPKV